MTDLSSRAQAREEVAEDVYMATESIDDIIREQLPKSRSVHELAALIAANLPRLAGLLGYVKADGEVDEHLVCDEHEDHDFEAVSS